MSEEAIRFPSAGAIFWAEAKPDGSGAARGIAGPPPAVKVTLQITDTMTPPRGIAAKIGARGCAFLAPAFYYDHAPTVAERAAPPASAPVNVQGRVDSLDGRYFSRKFKITSNPASPNYVALHPSRQATRVTEAGAVILTLKYQSGAPASWSIATLTCTRNGQTLAFSGQADANGDVIIPLTGLPPLTAPQTNDVMTLAVLADFSQAGQDAGDPDALLPAQISTGGAFAAQQTLNVVRGQISKAADLNIASVVLQSS